MPKNAKEKNLHKIVFLNGWPQKIGHSRIELQVGQEFCFLNALYRNFAWSSRASKCFKYIISLNFLHVKSDCIDNSTNNHKYHWKYHARNLRSKHLTKTWFPFRLNKFFRMLTVNMLDINMLTVNNKNNTATQIFCAKSTTVPERHNWDTIVSVIATWSEFDILF